jgi:phenylpropionate dioxygenase-like ring-hydroxylating dioxygenase large terminal subunit
MGHFPYVHSGILGEEPHTEVKEYDVEVPLLKYHCEHMGSDPYLKSSQFIIVSPNFGDMNMISRRKIYRMIFSSLRYKKLSNSDVDWISFF